MIWLLGALGFIKRLFAAALDLAVKHPWQAALIAALVFAGWQWHGKGKAIEQRDAARHEIASLKAASKANAEALEKQRRDAENRYAQLAKDADNDHAKDLAAANDAADRYIAAHRVRAGTCLSPAAAVAQGETAAIPESPAAVPDAVAVSASDVRTCAADYSYARSAWEWAQSLVADGKAE